MKRLATLLVAAGALALVLVALAPDPASAGFTPRPTTNPEAEHAQDMQP